MKIGIMDSGIGGITVLKVALQNMSSSDFIYYADTIHAPYGTKPKKEVKQYIFNVVNFLVQHSIDALVIACNTATSIAVKELRTMYSFPIVGMEPAVNLAVKVNPLKKILVFATPLTLKEEKYKLLVNKFNQQHLINSHPLPELVRFAENYIFDDTTVLNYLSNQLKSYNLEEYGTVVLGCTHFPFFKNHFKKILPAHIKIIDGHQGTINHLKTLLSYDNTSIQTNKSKITFYYSGELDVDNKILRKYLDLY